MYKIIEINSLIQLDKYKDEWTNLLHTEKISLFQSFTWTRTWIKHFSKGKKTRVYLIFSDNKIRCVIPVFVHRSTYLTLPARVMRLIGYPESDYNDIILEHTGKDILSFCVDNVFSSRLKWDVLQFDEIPETSATGNLLVNAFRDKGYRVLHYRTSTCCYIPVEGDYDNYLKSLSSKMRTNLRTSQKKLRQVGQVTFFRYHGNLADWNRSLEQAFVLETKSWKGRKNLGILYDQSHRQFHKDLLTSLTKGDIAEFTFMTVNDKPISHLFSLRFQVESSISIL
jgi:CelD/BcsL family acetyltransferase involved in cellulose biosynthesis